MKNNRYFNNLILVLIMTAVFTFGGLVSVMATDEEGQGTVDAQNVQEIQTDLEVEADVDVDADVEKSDVDEEVDDVDVDADVDDEEEIEISEDEETLEEEVDVVDDEEDVVEEIIDEEEDFEVIEVIDEEDVEDEDIEDVDAEDVDENNDEEERTIVIPPAEVEEINEIGDAVYEPPYDGDIDDEEIVVVIPPAEVEPIEEIGGAVYEPPMNPVVTVSQDNEEAYEIFVDEEGVAEISGLFHKFDEGASGSETLELTVNGVSYMITVGSDGSILGELPEGFSIKDGVLRIEGVYEDIDLVVTRLYAMSAIYEGPVFEEPMTLAAAGTIRTTSYSVAANTENSSSSSNYYGYADYYTYDEIAAETEEAAEAEEITDDEEVTEEFIFPEDIEDEEDAVLGAYSDDTGGNFPTAILLIGVAGAIAALGGIWKVGLFRA